LPASPPSSHSLFQHSNDKKSALRQTLPDLCVQAQPPQQQQHHQQREVVKLFVGQIPKTLEEDGVREVFHEFGEIVEVVILRDRRTSMHQGCCFVKYSNLIAAQSAINALHNQRSLPPLRNPLQVRFADSAVSAVDRGQTNAENKLFVGGVPPGCGDKELRALFNTYGEVLDVYILASKGSQEGQRGCAFVRYSQPTSCTMAIEALHGKYAMKAGELPLVVRYADPPKNQRGGGGYGRFPPGWSPSPAVWPAGPPPMGWPIPPWGGAMGMPGPFPPWVMPPGVAQPSVPGYGFYGPQYGAPQAGPPSSASQQQINSISQAHQYAHIPTPPPLGSKSAQPPLPPPPPPSSYAGWTEHITPEGLRYYYNTASGTSSWEPPPEIQVAQVAHQRPQPVPLPPLPTQAPGTTAPAVSGSPGAGSNLEHAMEALNIQGCGQSAGSGTSAYTQAQSSSSPIGAAGYINANGLGMGPGSSIAALSGLGGMAQNGAVDSLLTAPGGGAPGERPGSTTPNAPTSNGGNAGSGGSGGSAEASNSNVLVQEWAAGNGQLGPTFPQFANLPSADAASGGR